MSLLAIRIVFTMQDGKGKVSKTEIKIPASVTLNNVATIAIQAAGILSNLTKARITSVRACVGLNITTTSVTQSDADIEDKAFIGYQDANANFGKLMIPTIDEAFVLPASDRLDVADAAMLTLFGLIVTGDGTIAPVTKRNGSVTAVTTAREIFRS